MAAARVAVLLAALLVVSTGGAAAADRRLLGATATADAAATVTVDPSSLVQLGEQLVAEANALSKEVVQQAYQLLNTTDGEADDLVKTLVAITISANTTGYELLQVGKDLIADAKDQLDAAGQALQNKAKQLLDYVRTKGPELLQQGKDLIEKGKELVDGTGKDLIDQGAALVEGAGAELNSTGAGLVQQGADLVKSAGDLVDGSGYILIFGHKIPVSDVYGKVQKQLQELGQELAFIGAQINAGAKANVTASAGRKLLQGAGPGDAFAAMGAQLLAFGEQLTLGVGSGAADIGGSLAGGADSAADDTTSAGGALVNGIGGALVNGAAPTSATPATPPPAAATTTAGAATATPTAGAATTMTMG